MKTILLVEDDFVQRTFLLTSLQSKGYKVYACDLAEQAIAFYKTNEIDYVVTDVSLPDLDGFNLLQGLQIINPKVKVIAMTSSSNSKQSNAKELAMRNGFSDFLVKPVNVPALVQKFSCLH